MKLFDSHTHIQAPEFDADRDAVIARAGEAGLAGMLVLGWDVPSSERAVELAQAHPDVFAAAGCHPHDAASMDDASLARLDELARHPRVAAVGEIGLDFYRNLSPREAQLRVLHHHLQTAAELSKPVAVHCREAHETFLPIAEAWSRKLGRKLPDGRPLGVLHYFSGDAELGIRYVELGFLISIHTSVTYPNSQQLQEVARTLPLECLLVETDSPYGAPQSIRGRRNEPARVTEAAAKIAALRGEPVERVAEATTANAYRLFGVDPGLAKPAGKAAARSA
jgi:TatD DNase family protein